MDAERLGRSDGAFGAVLFPHPLPGAMDAERPGRSDTLARPDQHHELRGHNGRGTARAFRRWRRVRSRRRNRSGAMDAERLGRSDRSRLVVRSTSPAGRNGRGTAGAFRHRRRCGAGAGILGQWTRNGLGVPTPRLSLSLHVSARANGSRNGLGVPTGRRPREERGTAPGSRIRRIGRGPLLPIPSLLGSRRWRGRPLSR